MKVTFEMNIYYLICDILYIMLEYNSNNLIKNKNYI